MSIQMKTVWAAAALVGAAGAAYGQCELGTLTATAPAGGDFFGSALAAYSNESGDRLMIGARLDDTAAAGNAGSVFTFGRFANNQWGFLSQFMASDGQVNDYFGTAVGVSDPYAVVGAPGAGTGGAAYFFSRFAADWVEQNKATLPSPVAGDDFGVSAAMSGTWAIVGAPGRDFASNPDGGAAYFFQRQANGTWSLISGARGDSQFGNDAGSRLGAAVAMSGAVAVVGAPFFTTPAWPSEHGVIRVYRRDAQGVWQWEEILASNNPGSGDQYGAAVATDGTFIAVGAPYDDRSAAQGGELSNSGCVYIQRYNGSAWTIDGQVFAPDAAAGAFFGSSVAISGDRLVVGAPGARKAYVFRRVAGQFGAQWVADETISGVDGPNNFGAAVAWDGTTAAIGSELDDTPSLTNSGAVYLRRPALVTSDSCGGARAISAGTITGCTTFASRDGSTTCGNPAIQGPDVWFTWTPRCSGNVIVDTIGSGFDTVLSVHDGCPEQASTNTIVCNDDAGGVFGNASLLSFDYAAGTTYFIRVSGYGGASGEFTLRVNDWYVPGNDACANSQAVSDGVYEFATCRATTDGPAECGVSQPQIYNDVWFHYTAPVTGTTTIALCGSSFDTKLAVYDAIAGCPTQSGTALACNDDAGVGSACAGTLQSFLTFPAVGGQTYKIRVGGYGAGANNSGDATMQVFTTGACPADWDGNGAVNSNDISAFLTTWLASVGGGTLAADFNHDQTTNSNDISAFLTAWLAAVGGGC